MQSASGGLARCRYFFTSARNLASSQPPQPACWDSLCLLSTTPVTLRVFEPCGFARPNPMSQRRPSSCQTSLTDSRFFARLAKCKPPFNRIWAAKEQAREHFWAFVHRSSTLNTKDSFIQETVSIGCNYAHRCRLHRRTQKPLQSLQNRCLWDRSRLPQNFEIHSCFVSWLALISRAALCCYGLPLATSLIIVGTSDDKHVAS